MDGWNVGQYYSRQRRSHTRRISISKGSDIERPIKLIYPLELNCDDVPETKLNEKAAEFRPRKPAAVDAKGTLERYLITKNEKIFQLRRGG